MGELIEITFEDVKKHALTSFVSSETFMNEWAAEDLEGEDMEYVEWVGEYQFYARLNERLSILKGIENVSS